MKKKYLALIILLAILLGCKSKIGNNPTDFRTKEKIAIHIGNQEKDLIFSFNKVKSFKRERIFKNYKLFHKFNIGTLEDTTFLYPGRIKIDSNENIYILDFMDFSVKKFDQMGNFVEKYGKKGKGPGELINPFDFDVFNTGEVAFLGLNDNKFIIFDGKSIKDFKTKLMPNRICFLSPNEVVTFQIMDPIESSPFQKVNFQDEIVIDLENILTKNSLEGKNFGMLPFLLGDLHRYDSNKVLYVSSILGYVVLFNTQGKITKVFKLLSDFQESIYKRNRYHQSLINFPRQEEYLFESSGVYSDNLFILFNPIRWSPQKYIVDIYSISEGEYKYSLLFNENSNLKEVFLTDDKIYLIRENTEVEVFNYSIIE